MTDDRKSGILLIAGALGGLLTMAIHPTAARSMTADEAGHLATVSAIAHSLAMVSFAMTFLGGIGLTVRLGKAEREGDKDRLAVAGVVAFGVACVAVLLATAVSGFIVPGTLRLMARDTADSQAMWRIATAAIFQFNVAFSKIYTVGTSVAMVLWSASAVRNGGLGRNISVYGCVAPALVTVLVAVGHLRLDVHGMAVVVLVHAIWFGVVGVQMMREGERPRSA